MTAEPMTDIDVTGAAVLSDVVDLLAAQGVVLAFVEMKGHVPEHPARSGLVDQIGTEHPMAPLRTPSPTRTSATSSI